MTPAGATCVIQGHPLRTIHVTAAASLSPRHKHAHRLQGCYGSNLGDARSAGHTAPLSVLGRMRDIPLQSVSAPTACVFTTCTKHADTDTASS